MIWVGIGFTVVSYATLLAVWIFYSVPRSGDKGWTDPGYFMRVAHDTPIISVVLGVLGIVTDFYVIAIPLTAISSLNLSTKKKLGVSALFITGLLACAFSVAGLSPRIENIRLSVSGVPDPFWISMPSYGLAVAEINLGIVCACVPVIVPLMKALLAKLSHTTSIWQRYWKKTADDSTDMNNLEAGKRSPAQNPNYCGRRLLSFNRGSQKPRGTPSTGTITVTQATEIHMVPYSELRSIDMDYHTYLCSGKNASHAASAERGRAG
ncbi:hypothetical protein J3459_008621 [Metarhizium acridum]|nr:hypothetical protein J3459_008621 [Metarhizium acridum]